jgi:hypothetical protein
LEKTQAQELAGLWKTGIKFHSQSKLPNGLRDLSLVTEQCAETDSRFRIIGLDFQDFSELLNGWLDFPVLGQNYAETEVGFSISRIYFRSHFEMLEGLG